MCKYKILPPNINKLKWLCSDFRYDLPLVVLEDAKKPFLTPLLHPKLHKMCMIDWKAHGCPLTEGTLQNQLKKISSNYFTFAMQACKVI